MTPVSIHVLTGDDESILRAAVNALVQTLVADGDRALMVDEFDAEDYTPGGVVEAAQTAPFLTDRRVVVARDAGRFTADELVPLFGYLADPLPSTDLVIEWGNQRRPKALDAALTGAGAVIVSTTPPNRPRDRGAWVQAEAKTAGVRLNGAAVDLIVGHLGENVGSLDGVLRTLSATFGTHTVLGPEHVEPFLGDAGGVPPWDLTDAIDSGRTSRSIELLGRMLGAGERHPLQVMAILQGHYGKLATLDGRQLRTEADAAAALGIKPGYPARKALEQARRLGGTSIRRAIDLLAAADLDLRGRRDLDSTLVVEILVARLSRLART
jgi:DNA polymerase III subunit delta